MQRVPLVLLLAATALLLSLSGSVAAYPSSKHIHHKGDPGCGQSLCVLMQAPGCRQSPARPSPAKKSEPHQRCCCALLLLAGPQQRQLLPRSLQETTASKAPSQTAAAGITQSLLKDDASAAAESIAQAASSGDVDAVASALAFALANGGCLGAIVLCACSLAASLPRHSSSLMLCQQEPAARTPFTLPQSDSHPLPPPMLLHMLQAKARSLPTPSRRR